MRAFRIVKKGHALTAFLGDGARAYGGRWNHPGVPMVYTAQTRALAALESLVHFGGEERKVSFVAFEIEIPERLAIHVAESSLPRGWRSEEPSSSTQGLGSDWQASGRSAALVVPSVIVPQEYCVLINPEHPDIDKILVNYPEPFEFDRRL